MFTYKVKIKMFPYFQTITRTLLFGSYIMIYQNVVINPL